MRKHQKDESTTYSDNDDRWNNATYKVDVVGVVENIGRPKSYPSGFYDEPPIMKYFMSIKRKVEGGDDYTQKMMVTCDDVERQRNRPAIGSKVHFKTTKDGEWLSISAKAPFEFWGDTYTPEKEEVWIGGLNKLDRIQIMDVREKSVFVCWVFPINATEELPEGLEYAKDYRNNVAVFHLAKEHAAPHKLWCGTTWTTGATINETDDEERVNCKKCLQKLKLKDDLVDVLLLSTYIPRDHVRLTGDTMDVRVDHCDIGKACEIAEWIWDVKLEENDWWVEPVRVRSKKLRDVLKMYQPRANGGGSR